MSGTTEQKITFVCKKCHREIETNIKTHIDNRLDKDDVQSIFEGSFFIRHCDACGENNIVNFPIGYKHSDSGRSILFLPIDSHGKFNNVNTPEGYRVTHDMMSFIEKVRISEMGLDDKIIELVKIVAYNQVSQIGKVPDEALESIGCWVKDDLSIDLDLRCGGRHYLLEVPRQMYLDIETKFANTLKSYKEPKIVDLNWALMFLNAITIENDTQLNQDIDDDDWDEIIF